MVSDPRAITPDSDDMAFSIGIRKCQLHYPLLIIDDAMKMIMLGTISVYYITSINNMENTITAICIYFESLSFYGLHDNCYLSNTLFVIVSVTVNFLRISYGFRSSFFYAASIPLDGFIHD